jgi:hypothetical protein
LASRALRLLPGLYFAFYSLITVDDFVAAGAHEFNRIQQRSGSGHKAFSVSHLQATKSYKFQQALESGSGPGGRRFKSSLPDQSFQTLKRYFWFFVYIDGVEIVDGHVFLNFPLGFHREITIRSARKTPR